MTNFVSGEDWRFTYKSIEEIKKFYNELKNIYPGLNDAFDLPVDEEDYYYEVIQDIPKDFRELTIYIDYFCVYYKNKITPGRFLILKRLIEIYDSLNK